MFSALSLSQQLRTSIATVSCFGGLSKEPPVSARKGSARRASGASVDDLFDRYAPELEPMTAPGTSPSQVRSHIPPEPTPRASVSPLTPKHSCHRSDQLCLAVPPPPTSASPPAQDEDEATDRLAGLCAAIVSQDTLPPSSPRSFPFPSAVTRELKPDKGALSKPKPKPAAPQSTTVWRPRITRHKKAAAEDEEEEEDVVEPADEEDASEDDDDDEPPSPAEKKKKKKPAPKGPVHRRDRNRVNARNSRAKKEHYIKWLEIKAGVTVTSQGGKDRRDAVEAAWEEEEAEEEAEVEAGGCEKKKRNRAAAGLTSPSGAKKRGKKKK